jgi:hypothetical protein
VQERHPIVYGALMKLIPIMVPSAAADISQDLPVYKDITQALATNLLTSDNIDKVIDILKDISDAGPDNFDQSHDGLSKEGKGFGKLLEDKENSTKYFRKIMEVYQNKRREEKDKTIFELEHSLDEVLSHIQKTTDETNERTKKIGEKVDGMAEILVERSNPRPSPKHDMGKRCCYLQLLTTSEAKKRYPAIRFL